jgi:N6-L-threonylcarbamoyladenine synthase
MKIGAVNLFWIPSFLFDMTILGIETSCDETAAAVWSTDHLAANIIASQDVHRIYGGVVPELASRAHIRLITPVVSAALDEAGLVIKDIDGIAVTYGPGLAGALLVGLNFAKAVAFALNVPFIGINHLEGHLFSNTVDGPGPEPPFLSLIVSGGHTQLVLIRQWREYEIIGTTRDDAVGEAFDKVAKMLDLPYPGGPAIDTLSLEGDPTYLAFPKGQFKDNAFDFSYSGLKTAVLYHLKSLSEAERVKQKANIAASFQLAAVEALVDRSIHALEKLNLKQLALAGGVACNRLLRSRLDEQSRDRDFTLYYPRPVLCTDNAAMIARAGKHYMDHNVRSLFSLAPQPALHL